MEIWSWTLAITGLFCTWLTGTKKSWSWLVWCADNVLIVYWAITTQQYGFILGAVISTIIALDNYRKWRHDDGKLRR